MLTMTAFQETVTISYHLFSLVLHHYSQMAISWSSQSRNPVFEKFPCPLPPFPLPPSPLPPFPTSHPTPSTHLCPEMHAMANLAILTKSCHSIDDDEFGEIVPILPKSNVSYANYPNTEVTHVDLANLARVRQIRQTA